MLKTIIEEQFKENTDYNSPGQAVNQMQSLFALSKDLYTDSIRFIYELLQNADDSNIGATKVKVSVRLFGNNLVISHNGKAFDERDIQGLCAVNNGTKKKETDKTGFKGIGFKSVFGQSEKVTVFSNGEYFRFDSNYKHTWVWIDTKENWEATQDRLFKFPWQIIPIYTEPHQIPTDIHNYLIQNSFTVATIVEIENTANAAIAINELSEKVDMFLFLKHIEEIDFHVESKKVIKITVTQDDETALTLNGVNRAKYLLKNIKLIVPKEVKNIIKGDSNVPEKLQLAETLEISLAAKIGADGIETLTPSESLLYAYLPTEERKYYLPVLVNAAFLTTANRETLHTDSAWNQWIFNTISKELFNWIAELVISRYADEAYRLLPEKLSGDNALVKAFNKGYDFSILNSSFILTYENKLVKISEGIIDETFLNSNVLFGQNLIRSFIISECNLHGIDLQPFIPHRKFTAKFKKLGVAAFKWSDFPKLLSTPSFLSTHSVTKNTELILLLKKYSEEERPLEINDETLKKWSFLLDHKKQLKSPEEIFFPQIDDSTWNSPDSELSFIDPDIQKWLDNNIQIRLWLVKLGVVEKSDLTYFQKTILPNATDFVTLDNAVETIHSIFMLYKRNELSSEVLNQLSALSVLTLAGTLIPASDAYFSSIYEPKLDLQAAFQKDFYLNNVYISTDSDVDDLKRFFKYLGVKERIAIKTYPSRESKAKLIVRGLQNQYFDAEDKSFWSGYFKAYSYSGLIVPSLLDELTAIGNLSKLFWTDLISHVDPNLLLKNATAYWGHTGRAGDTSGNEVGNYLKWFIQNQPSIPGTTGECLISSQIFLNDEYNLNTAGKYLAVFDGPQLEADWRSFFNFKAKLQLEDYLLLLKSVSEDYTTDNKARIQIIYEYLLENINNLDSATRVLVKTWALEIKLLDQKGDFILATNLKYYPDGDNSIFQNKFYFIQINSSNKKHPDLADLFSLLGVEILHQSSFQLQSSNENNATGLSEKISSIIPFWAKWTENEAQSGYEEREHELRTKFEKATFKSADELVVTFGEDWSKEVSVYFKDDVIHVLTEWQANDVLLILSAKLCEYFKAKRFESELGFLLRSTDEEIIRYFKRENIELPKIEIKSIVIHGTVSESIGDIVNHDFKKTIDYATLWNNNITRNKNLIDSANASSKTLLLNGLHQQKPGSEINVYHFSHIENAVTIIRQQQLKSRQSASFQDSAGAGIISQTLEDRKLYARFYFRSHTPTQFYVENWGRGHYSLEHIGSDPVCPVPVFFIIPIDEIIDEVDWKVSLGTMASSHVEYGNSFDTVSKFDFEGVYKMKSEIGHDRYMAASHQEFLVKDYLNLENLSYRLAVQDESAKNSLLIMLNDNAEWESRIEINAALFYNENPKININQDDDLLKTVFENRKGHFVLQHFGNSQLIESNLHNVTLFQNEGITTIISDNDISLFADFTLLKYNLFYCYKGHLWLINTNNFDSNSFNTGYITVSLQNWFNTSTDRSVLLNVFKMHPELNDWYATSIGGPDSLTLEKHTLAVLENYQKYFQNSQKIFSDEATFLAFIALHDIGKPKAISMGSRHDQHKYTLEIIDKISSILSISGESIKMMKTLINEDPIGKYLNPYFSESLDVTSEKILKLQENLGVPFADFWGTYLVYYQCDAGGYQSLSNLLFEIDDSGELQMTSDKKRFVFKDTIEAKFQLLENKLNVA